MRFLVRNFLRGLFVCTTGLAITACIGLSGDDSRWPTVDQPGDAAEAPLSGVNAIRLRVAQNALKNGEFDTAIRFFSSIQEAEPGHYEPLMGLGEASMAKRDFDAAEVAFRKAIGTFPRRAETYEGLGRALVAKNDFKGAIDAFNRALARAPSAAVHNKLGVAHDLMGDGEGAQKHYRNALLLDPDTVSARNNLALSLAISQKYDEAIGEMERVAALPAATDRHRQNLAFIYGMAGQFDAAARILGKQPQAGSEQDKERNDVRPHPDAGQGWQPAGGTCVPQQLERGGIRPRRGLGGADRCALRRPVARAQGRQSTGRAVPDGQKGGPVHGSGPCGGSARDAGSPGDEGRDRSDASCMR